MIGEFLVLTLLYSSHAFEMVCPSTEQWYLRALIKCSSSDQYTCLSDFSEQIYNESCSGPIVALPGERRVISNNNFDIKPCTPGRYQPFTFSSTQGRACLFQKEKCSEEGLLLYSNGTSEMDRTCRCDYTRGFAFSSTDRKDSCSCIAATEDCSCYKKDCNESQVLSPDYKCINETQQQHTFVCSFIISSKESVINITDVVTVNVYVPILPYTQVYRYVTATCCTIMLVLMIVFCILVYLFKETIRKKLENFNFIKDLEDQDCFECGSVTFTCEVNQDDLPGRWSKNGQELKASESISLTAVGKVHTLLIHSVRANDSGNYSCHIKDKVSQSKLTVNKVELMKLLKKQYCSEGDPVTFLCSVDQENIHGKWIKDGVELKSSESINITAVGKTHRLAIDSVTANQSGIYSFCISNKISSARLTVLEVTIIKPIEEQQQYFKGDKVTFTCEVNSEVLPGTWFKDGQELSGSDDLDIIADGSVREIIIKRVTVDDRGYYSFNIAGKYSGGLLVVLDEFTPDRMKYIRLFHLLETVAEPVVRKIFDSEIHPNQLKKMLNQNKNIIDKLKRNNHINIREYLLLYTREVEYSVKFMIKNYDCKRIYENKEENLKLRAEIECTVLDLYSSAEGDHKVKVVSFESVPLIVVLHLKSTSNENCLKKIFKTAIDKGKVGSFETESTGFQFTRLEKFQAASKDFNIRLMMVLMKNLIDFNIADVFPSKDNVTVVADLSRIKYLRNKIAHNSDMSITDEDFDKDWKHLSEAVQRLGSVADKKMCEELKSLRPTLQHVQGKLEVDCPHIMISYHWDSLSVMLKVKDRLKEAGYKVWMDVEHMTGSTLEAIEKAAVVLIAMSQKYKDSPSCRSEAEYTYKLRKSFIPLLLQHRYVPDGWLGMLIGTRLYFHISSEDKIYPQMDNVIKELGNRGKIGTHTDTVDEYLNSENLQRNQEHTSTDSLKDLFLENEDTNLFATEAVRRIFDKQFPPLKLEKEIKSREKELAAMKEDRKITQSQWDDLFPSYKESLSSSRFDIKVMMILLSSTSFKEKDVFKKIENLQIHLFKPEHEDRAIKEAIKEINKAV